MNEQAKKYIPVQLDDAIIKATNDDGTERLRLGVKVEGHDVYIRFPAWEDVDLYKQDLSKLLFILGKTAGYDIELDVEKVIDMDKFQEWAYFMSQALRFSPCNNLLSKIFFTYLRPEVPTIDETDYKKWLKKHLDINQVVYVLISILHMEDWLKKKAMEELAKMVPNLIPQPLKDTSVESSTSTQPNYGKEAPYVFS